VTIVAVQDTLPYQEFQLVLFQGLDNELAVCCVKEKAVRFTRSNLELSHLMMIFSRCERLQEELIVESGPLFYFISYVSIEFRNSNLYSATLCEVCHTKLWILFIEPCNIHDMVEIVRVSPIFLEISSNLQLVCQAFDCLKYALSLFLFFLFNRMNLAMTYAH